LGILSDESDPVLDKVRKKLPQVAAPEDAMTREYYRRNVQAQQRLARQIANDIPIAQRLPGSLLPKEDVFKMLPTQKRMMTEGSLDPGAVGKCGEKGATCGMLYQNGYRACTGTPVYDERGMVRKMGTPCPYYKQGIKMPFTSGRIIVDALRR
jgi:hypothetical protein